jgi:hypothetical protein
LQLILQLIENFTSKQEESAMQPEQDTTHILVSFVRPDGSLQTFEEFQHGEQDGEKD